jgi:hypothetical protein
MVRENPSEGPPAVEREARLPKVTAPMKQLPLVTDPRPRFMTPHGNEVSMVPRTKTATLRDTTPSETQPNLLPLSPPEKVSYFRWVAQVKVRGRWVDGGTVGSVSDTPEEPLRMLPILASDCGETDEATGLWVAARTRIVSRLITTETQVFMDRGVA